MVRIGLGDANLSLRFEPSTERVLEETQLSPQTASSSPAVLSQNKHFMTMNLALLPYSDRPEINERAGALQG